MNKRAVQKKIVEKLKTELELYFRAAKAAHAEATHEQSRAENKYDTRGLEASYLARGQSRQAAELEASISAFEKMEPARFEPGDPIGLGALVELEQGKRRTFYFVGPRAGGTEIEHDKIEVLVITPQSPLGEQLQGKKQGDRLRLTLAEASNQYRVVGVS